MKELNKVCDYWGNALDNNVQLIPGEELFFNHLLSNARKSHKILEIGVGKGRMVKILKTHGVTAQFYGIDLTENVKDSGTIGTIGDARSLPFPDNTFDLVYSLGVIEHFPETKLAILEHARVAKKKGCVLITTPHLSLFTPLRYFVYFLKFKKIGTFEEIMGRNLRMSTIQKYFQEANLISDHSGVFGMFGIKTLLRKIGLKWIRSNFQKNILFGAYLYISGIKQ